MEGITGEEEKELEKLRKENLKIIEGGLQRFNQR